MGTLDDMIGFFEDGRFALALSYVLEGDGAPPFDTLSDMADFLQTKTEGYKRLIISKALKEME